MMSLYKSIVRLWAIFFVLTGIIETGEWAQAQSNPIIPQTVKEASRGDGGALDSGGVVRDAERARTLAESIGGARQNASHLGEIVIEVIEDDKPSDGYWEWFVEHIGKVSEFNKQLTETRIQLAYHASEITRAKAERFKLARMRMEWLVSKDESINFAGWNLGQYFDNAIVETAKVGTQARKANQRHSKELGDDIRSRIQSQKSAIDSILKTHTNLITRTKAQLEKSGENRPALTAEVSRLEEFQLLLPLFLYDYAAWYAPDQLPRLINDFIAKEPLDRDLEFLLRAKAKVADAEELERKAFAERLRPSADNKQRMLFARATIKGDPLGYLAGRTSVTDILKTVTTADVYQTTSQTQRLDAIALMREILRTNRNHGEAKALVLQQELYWLKRIAQKLEGQSEMAMSAFTLYLKNRGFDPIHREGWWPWLKDYASAVWGLGPISMFAGVPGIDLPGANAELAGSQVMEAARHKVALTAIIRLVKAGHTLSELKAMDSGALKTVLSEYWELTDSASSKHHKAVTKMAVDIHGTLRQLRDLDRLSTDDGDRFGFAQDVNEFFAKNYFTPVNSRYQSFEWFGDLLNVHNIVTLWGPGAIAKVGGKWAKTPYMSFAQQDTLQKAGHNLATMSRSAISRVLDSQKVMIRGYNLDTIGHMIRNSKSMKLLGKAHDNAMKPLFQGNAFTNLLADSSKLVAAFYINNAVTEIAKSSGIPGAALLTELLMSYEVPHGIYDYLVLKAPVTPLTGMVKPLRRYRDHVRGTQLLASETQETIDEARELLNVARQETLDASNAGNEAAEQLSRIENLQTALQNRRLEQINTIVESSETVASSVSGAQTIDAVASQEIPHSTLQASEDALMSAVASLRQGDLEEAEQALEAARTLAERTTQDADIISRQVSQVIDDLESASVARATVGAGSSHNPTVDASDAPESISSQGTIEADVSLSTQGTIQADAPVEPPRSVIPSAGMVQHTGDDLSDIVFKTLDDRETVRALIDPELYSQGMAGEQLRLADEAGLQNGDFDSALAHLDDAKRYAQEMDESTEIIEVVIESRKTLIAHARDARAVIMQRRMESHNFPALQEVTQSELSVILDKLKKGDFTAGKGGLNAALDIKVGNETFRIKPTQRAEGVEAETVGGAIADMLGFDAPASAMLDAKGVTVTARGETLHLDKVVVTRSIDELVPLRELEEPVLLALRADYADQRVLRAWLADSDGHLGNIGLGPNGKLWIIDTDLANFGKTPLLRQLNLPLQNESDLMEAALTMAHGRVPHNPRIDQQVVDYYMDQIRASPLYRWIHRADQMVASRDIAPMVEKIKKVMSSPSAFTNKLNQRGINPGRAKEIFNLLNKRKDVLEDVLMKPSLFGGDGVQMSGIELRTAPRFASNPQTWRLAA